MRLPKESFVRVTFTVPKRIATALEKRRMKNKSRFVAEAIAEKMAREHQARALQELANLPPAFPEIADGAAYIRQLRAENEERERRLGR